MKLIQIIIKRSLKFKCLTYTLDPMKWDAVSIPTRFCLLRSLYSLRDSSANEEAFQPDWIRLPQVGPNDDDDDGDGDNDDDDRDSWQ
jgi:hypothetical protein